MLPLTRMIFALKSSTDCGFFGYTKENHKKLTILSNESILNLIKIDFLLLNLF